MKRLLVYRHRPAADELSLFPSEHGGGVAFTNDEIVRQSKAFAPLYVSVIDAVASRQASVQGIDLKAARVVARIACVPILHVILDRAVRLDRLHRQHGPFAVVPAEPIEAPASIDRFGELAGKSAAFNQDVVVTLAQVWGLALSGDEPVGTETTPLSQNEPGFRNHLFFVAGTNRWRRLRQRIRLGWSERAGCIPATAMLNMRVPLLDAGLYGRGRLAHVPDRLPFADGKFDARIRSAVVLAVRPEVDRAVRLFCDDVGLNGDLDRLVPVVCGFLGANYPTNLLEAAPENLATARRHLLPYRGRALVSGSLGFHTQAAWMVAGARTLDMEVIGMQHGGHYGYSEEHTGAYEGEYACCDRFISWGWTRLPSHPAITQQTVTALPAPWLSVRQRQWDELLTGADRTRTDKPYDILFMPNKVYPFPPAPSGSHATVNHLQQFAADMRTFVTDMHRAGLRILHKPYNRITTELLSDTSRELAQLGGEHYRVADTLDKGLTPELLRQCHVVVWDQPGTGLLECLTAGIPNMVLWPRLFNSEPAWAAGIFAELEEVGIVHRRTATLIEAVERVKAAPLAWLHDASRADVVCRFCREYACVDPHWDRYWREFLAQLARC